VQSLWSIILRHVPRIVQQRLKASAHHDGRIDSPVLLIPRSSDLATVQSYTVRDGIDVLQVGHRRRRCLKRFRRITISAPTGQRLGGALAVFLLRMEEKLGRVCSRITACGSPESQFKH
jgi:hypothetical protein